VIHNNVYLLTVKPFFSAAIFPEEMETIANKDVFVYHDTVFVACAGKVAAIPLLGNKPAAANKSFIVSREDQRLFMFHLAV